LGSEGKSRHSGEKRGTTSLCDLIGPILRYNVFQMVFKAAFCRIYGRYGEKLETKVVRHLISDLKGSEHISSISHRSGVRALQKNGYF